MSQNKLPTWAKFAGVVIAALMDNVWLIVLVIALATNEIGYAVAALIMAFYTRLSEIRDAILENKPELTLNLNGIQSIKKATSSEEHF